MKKIITALLLITMSLNTAQAVEQLSAEKSGNKLTLTEAIELGLNNNLDLKSTRLNIDSAKNDIKTANRLQNPDVNVFYNYGKSGYGNPQQIGLSQTIEIGKRGARKKLAKSNLALSEHNVAMAQFDLKMDIREAYIEFVAAKSVLRELQNQKVLMEELLKIAKRRFEVGVSPEMDVIQAELALNQLVTQINAARANVEKERYEFNKTLNVKNEQIVYDTDDDVLPFDTDFVNLMTPNPRDKLPQFSDISELALNKRYDIKIAKQQIDAAQKNLSVVMRQRIPDLAILGGYGYQSKSHSEDGTFKNGAYAGASIVNIPLFYTYSPEIKNAKIQVEQAKINYESTDNKAINDLRGAYEKFVIAQANLNYYDQNLLKKSNELMQISKKSYEVGKSNLTSLIVMEQSYRSIFLGYINALTDYYECWIDFLQEVNDEEIKLNAESV